MKTLKYAIISLMVLLVLLSGCGNKQAVTEINVGAGKDNDVVGQGNTVKVEYTGTFNDGTVFDSSAKHGKPLEFTTGANQVIRGFENGVLGMKLGEEKDITIPPEEAYGQRNPELVQKVQKDQLPAEFEPEIGATLIVALPQGNMPATITDITEDAVELDLNHMMAGKTLNFHIKLVGIT